MSPQCGMRGGGQCFLAPSPVMGGGWPGRGPRCVPPTPGPGSDRVCSGLRDGAASASAVPGSLIHLKGDTEAQTPSQKEPADTSEWPGPRPSPPLQRALASEGKCALGTVRCWWCWTLRIAGGQPSTPPGSAPPHNASSRQGKHPLSPSVIALDFPPPVLEGLLVFPALSCTYFVGGMETP